MDPVYTKTEDGTLHIITTVTVEVSLDQLQGNFDAKQQQIDTANTQIADLQSQIAIYTSELKDIQTNIYKATVLGVQLQQTDAI
jgi:hypothetical protein